MIYICTYGNECGTGGTLGEAFKELEEYTDELTVDDCIFYKAQEIEVKMELKQVQVPIQIGDNFRHEL